MDELFCDQSKAYPSDAAAAGTGMSAVTLYEHFREAIEQVGKTLADDENLLVIWYDPAGDPIAVDHIGYHNQLLIVVRGRNGAGLECTALVPAYSVQFVLKKVKKLPGEMRSPVNFMGHSVTPDPPPTPV